MPVYTQANLNTMVSAMTHGTVSAANFLTLANMAVRAVGTELDLRSTKRRASLSPNLFDEIDSYAAPTDLKGMKLIDIRPQVSRSSTLRWELVPEEEYDRLKDGDVRIVAIQDFNYLRRLLINAPTNTDDTLVISTLDALTAGGGTWTAVGDAEGLVADADNFVKGAGSVSWDIGAGGTTTAGIQNTTLTTFDLTDFTQGSVFVWVYIVATADITNFILRIGSDTDNYFQQTVTAAHDTTSFQTGWNLLRFDLSTATETGTVDLDAGDYATVYMTKAAGKINENNYRFDHLVVKKGDYVYVHYYSKFLWQTNASVYIENATATTDLLNADTEEFELIVAKTAELVAQFHQSETDIPFAKKRYEELRVAYLQQYPSEAMMLTQERWDFGSVWTTFRNDPSQTDEA